MYEKCHSAKCFSPAIAECLSQLNPEKKYVRLVFFGSPESQHEYRQHFALIRNAVNIRFKKDIPSISYVAQPPLLGNEYYLEAHSVILESDEVFIHKECGVNSYVMIKGQEDTALFISGINSTDFSSTVEAQSIEVFQQLNDILKIEHCTPDQIVRQWNYIENITGNDGSRQRYQEFNDMRSSFYAQTKWDNGYPAATGIGTSKGGVMIDADVLINYQTLPIDNPLQVAAYEYSERVLSGERQKPKTTPKFERARKVLNSPYNWTYISGTAAIRGEQTIDEDIEEQTYLTLDNMEQMIGKSISHIRVYVKHKALARKAESIISKRYPAVPTIYITGDICRDNLLIEIEGIAFTE